MARRPLCVRNIRLIAGGALLSRVVGTPAPFDGRIVARVFSVRNDLFPSFPDMARTVGILIFPEFQLLTAVGPITVFDAAARNSTSPPYRLRVIAPTAGPVTSSSGAQLIAEKFSKVTLDTLIVAGGRGTRAALACPQMLNFIRAPLVERGERRACARAHLSSREPDCSMVAAPPRIGNGQPNWRAPIRRSVSSPTASSFVMARYGPRPESLPASTSRSRWSQMTSGRTLPSTSRSSLWSTTVAPA